VAAELGLGGRGPRAFARLVTKLRFVIVLAWIAGASAATILLPSLSESNGAPLRGLIAEDSAAEKARLRSAELFEVPILSEVAIVQRDPVGLSEQAQRRVFERAAALDTREPGIEFALPITNTDRLFPGSREQSTTAITYLFSTPGTSAYDRRKLAEDFARTHVADPGDRLVGITGALPARLEETKQIRDSISTIEIATVLLLALILGLTYRSLGAPLLTLFSAGIAYLITVRVLPVLGDLLGAEMPQEIEPLVVVLLLGIVTDYAIFFLSGLRTHLAGGEQRLDAARRSTAQNLPIVLTAGLIVAAGATALLAGQLEYFRALGPGMGLTALMGLLVSTTLIPALVAIFGRTIFWPARPRPAPAENEQSSPIELVADQRERRSLRERFAYAATAKPLALLIVLLTGGVLFTASLGLRELDLGFTLIRGLPSDSEVHRAERAASQGFAPGIVAPTELLVEGPGVGADREGLSRLQEAIAGAEGVAGVVGPRDEPADIATHAVVSEDGNAARMAIILSDDPLGGPAIDDLRALEDSMPELLARAGLENARFAFAGDTALAENTVSLTVDDLKRIGLAALAINLLFLVVFLRSLVAPLFLLGSSMLALAATLGVTTFVFERLLGYDELTYYVPFAAAVLLVSLGSDYNVFVVGRVWQEARQQPLRDAIATAVPRASKTITIAGLALAASFALLALVPVRAFRELGFALALGVLVDAFVVRSFLVPALISLFGDGSWWPGERRIIRRRGRPARDPGQPSSRTTT
jgi:RND superfamily putative drug exporter